MLLLYRVSGRNKYDSAQRAFIQSLRERDSGHSMHVTNYPHPSSRPSPTDLPIFRSTFWYEVRWHARKWWTVQFTVPQKKGWKWSQKATRRFQAESVVWHKQNFTLRRFSDCVGRMKGKPLCRTCVQSLAQHVARGRYFVNVHGLNLEKSCSPADSGTSWALSSTWTNPLCLILYGAFYQAL